MNDIIFSLDPSSTISGWACLSQEGRLLQAGVLKPDKIRSEPQFRISRMCGDFLQLLNEFEPKIIVIEITSGKVGKRHTGSGAGLGVYGMAVGGLWQTAESWLRHLPAEQQGQTEIILVKENDWTHGVPKKDRAGVVASEFPEYKAADDPGGDVADAIALGRWYLLEHRARLVESMT